MGYQSGPPAGTEDFDFNEGLVVDAGEVLGKSNKPAPKPRSFDALRDELLRDEECTAVANFAANATTEVIALDDTDEEDDVAVDLGFDEVKASETGVKPREARPATKAWQHDDEESKKGMRRKEVSLFIGAPPVLPAGRGSSDCLVLLGGLPWWYSDADVRSQAENFGQVRCIRILACEKSGKSCGIALIEYLVPESAKKAADSNEGLRNRGLPRENPDKPARLVLVSLELFRKMRGGALPWLDGGSCSEELRAILMRQFDMSYMPAARRKHSRSPRRKGRGKTDSFRDSPEPQNRGGGDWADKLKDLKQKVHGGRGAPQMPPLMDDPRRARQRV